MSEFSESYHLRFERPDDAGELLRGLGLAGYVFPPTNGWVTFVAEGGVFEPDARILAAARQPLLHYVSAEDHGWSFALFENGEVTSAWRATWDGELDIDDTHYSLAALQRTAPAEKAVELAEFNQTLRSSDADELSGSDLSKTFA